MSRLFHVPARTLLRHFDFFLKQTPPYSIPKNPTAIWLKVDATHLGKWGCVMVYRADDKILYWQFAQRENYVTYYSGLRWLSKAGYIICGVTSDWHGSIVAAVEFVVPNSPHQRCLVHTQRLTQSLLTQNPKTEAGQTLLDLIHFLNKLKSHYEARIWLLWLNRWKKRYEHLTKQRSYAIKDDGTRTWWYTHKNVRRAFRTLWLTQKHLFLYLDYVGLDKDTNGLEANFAYLKEKLFVHRGLKRKRQLLFISWYLYFKSR